MFCHFSEFEIYKAICVKQKIIEKIKKVLFFVDLKKKQRKKKQPGDETNSTSTRSATLDFRVS